MPKGNDRIFISIGVSKPSGGLTELPGAITAAERMAAWAQAEGYTTLLLHDASLPEITIELLRERITEVILDVINQVELKRLVIFFAGHGAAQAVNDQYWILTNWNKRPTEAIKVSSLQRMLEYYGPKQVSIIGDACQDYSYKFIDLLGSSVLDKPDEEKQRRYELDQFFAAEVGMQAFMIKAKDDKKDFCLFTEVILDALVGDVQEEDAREICFEMIGGEKCVTSQSLTDYLELSVEREAGKYNLRMIPQSTPGFRSDRTYASISGALEKDARLPDVQHLIDFDSIDFDSIDFDGNSEAIGAAGEKLELRPRSVSKAKLLKPKPDILDISGRNLEALDMARKISREAFIDQVRKVTVRDHFETGCGICVSGTDVDKVEASFGVVSCADEQPNWFRIDLETGDSDSLGWSDTLVTLADGRIVSVCAVNNFVAALHIIDGASVSLFHRRLGADEYEGHEAINLLAQAHVGLLNQQEIIDTALMLRYGKHRVITLGCIAAQFYDAIRDVDSLCSIAAFYAMNHQPVPLDIILYGGGTISDNGGRLYADIPAVAARKPRTPEERRQSFTYDATPGFSKHPIAGRIPWMRQAWGAVSTANCDTSGLEWRRQALELMEYLAPGTFTITRPQGREALVGLAGINVNYIEPEPQPLKSALN